MALVLADRVRDTTTTTGTGTVTLSGTAPTGYQTFGTAIGNGNTTYYTINAGFQWEVGIGTYTTAGLTLSRTTVLSSSSAGALVDFAVGTKDVFVTYPAEKAVNYDGSDNVGIGTTAPTTKLTVVGTGSATTLATGLGAVGTPAYTFTGDLNTGMWSPATGNIAVSTGGVERMRIGSSGNVGIGTATPGSFGLLAAVKDATGVTTVAVSNGNAATNDGAKFSSFYATTEVTSLGHYWDGSQFVGKQFSYGDLTFLLGSTPVERMRLTAAGNLGIGTSAPSAKLNVAGDTVISGNADARQIGFNFYGTSQYNFYTDGAVDAAKMTIRRGTTSVATFDSAGNVGIGTASPGTKLEVSSTSAGATAEVLRLNNPGGGANTAAQIKFLAAGANYASVTGGYGAAAPQMTFNLPAGAGNYVWQNASVEQMRLDASGNLGIGTSAPGYKLDVSATGNISGQFKTSGSINALFLADAGTTAETLYVGTVGNDFRVVTGSNERMRITSAGLVGIGTSAPVGRLMVAATDTSNTIGSATASINITNIDANAFGRTSNLNFTLDDGNITTRRLATISAVYTGFSGGSTAGALVFATQFNGSLNERMRIVEAGNVGIGTSAPNATLVVSGAGVIGDIRGARNTLYLKHSASTSNQSSFISFGSAGSGGCFIGNDINADGTTVNQLNIQAGATGGVYLANGGTSWTAVSDERAKDIIEPISNAAQKVGALRAVIGKYKTDAEGTRRSFLIAQDVQAVLPEAVIVGTDEQQTLGVAYTDTIPLLVAAIKELTARVAQLEGK